MTEVKKHKSRSLPFGALLTKVFAHFHVNVRQQHNQKIDGNFTEHLIIQGLNVDTTRIEEERVGDDVEEGEEVHSRHRAHMDVDNEPQQKEIPLGPSTSEAPHWNMLLETMAKMSTTMNRYSKQLARIEDRQDQFFAHMGENYDELRYQQVEFYKEYHIRMTHLETQLDIINIELAQRPYPPPPPPPYDPSQPSSSHPPPSK